MKQRKIAVVSMAAVVLMAAGCATSGKAKESNALNARVEALESQVTVLNQRLDETAAQNAPASESGFPRSNIRTRTASTKPKLSVRQAQKALTTAGFYKGNVDGKGGPLTQKAVREFQQANGLKSDGVIGPATSEALSRYLQE